MTHYREHGHSPLIVVGTRAVALDRATGQPLWTYAGGTRQFLRLHVTNERVFLLDVAGNLHCLRLEDGAAFGVVPVGGSECTMLSVDDTLYVYSGRKVTAVNGSGQVLWQQVVGFDGEWGLVGMGVPGTEIQPDYSRS